MTLTIVHDSGNEKLETENYDAIVVGPDRVNPCSHPLLVAGEASRVLLSSSLAPVPLKVELKKASQSVMVQTAASIRGLHVL
jgi:hypothetical protein